MVCNKCTSQIEEDEPCWYTFIQDDRKAQQEETDGPFCSPECLVDHLIEETPLDDHLEAMINHNS